MSRAHALALVAALAGCHSVRPCAGGTLWLDLSFTDAAGADHLLVDATVAGRRLHDDTSLAAMTAGSLALDFAAGYPAGESLDLTVTAARGTTPLATASTTTRLSSGCTRLALALAPVHAVTLVGVTPAAQHGTTTTLSVAAPAGTAAGDLLVLALYIDSASATAQLPAGWSPVAELASGEGFHAWWLTRAADGAAASFGASFSAAVNAAAVVVAYRGVDPAQPIDARSAPTTLTGAVAGGENRFTLPAVTTTRAGDRLLALFVTDNYGQTWNQPPAGMTTLASDAPLGLFDVPGVVAGATGDFTAGVTFGGNDSRAGSGLVLALAPAP